MLSALPVLVVALVGSLASAQSTPTCSASLLSSFSWAFNSAGASPCDIAVSLGGACNNGLFALPPLLTNQVYIGPNATTQTACKCSSVYYSALSACAACQGASFLPWSNYNANCTVVYVQKFPNPIPPAVKVPAWAYLDVATGDTFSITAAKNAGGVESTALPQASQTSPPTNSPTNTATQSSKGVNAGAIAGGVIGGLVGLGLLVALIFWLVRRHKQKANLQPSGYNPAMSSYAPSTFVSSALPKPYDPNDPSTFPTNDNSGYGSPYAPTPPPDARSGIAPNFTGTTNHTQMTPARPHYTGAPEL